MMMHCENFYAQIKHKKMEDETDHHSQCQLYKVDFLQHSFLFFDILLLVTSETLS